MITLTKFAREIYIKGHNRVRTSVRGTKSYLVKDHIRKLKDREFIKGAISGALVTSAVFSAASLVHPAVRKNLFKNINFRDINLLRKTKLNPKELDEVQKLGADKIKKVLKNITPKTTKNFRVEMDKNKILEELKSIKQKNEAFLKTIPEDNRKYRKLKLQNKLIDENFEFAELEKDTYPDLMFRMYKTKKGEVAGYTLLKPNADYNALNLGTLFTPEGSDIKNAKEILEHTKQISKNLGYKGRIIGDPDENAIPLYKRYGAKQIPNTRYWIFEGDN